MNIARSQPIAIQQTSDASQRTHHGSLGSLQRTPRQRHDTITRIKDSFAYCQKNGQNVSPHLSSPTPPTFVPDGSHQISRIADYLLVEQVEGHNSGNVFRAVDVNTELEYICKVYSESNYRKSLEAYSLIKPHPNINHVVDIVIGNCKAYIFFQPGIPQEIKSNGSSCEKSEGFKAENLHSFTRIQERLSEGVAAVLFTQVVKAVDHCHQNDIVLQDLKLRKFIFRDSEKTQIMLESLEDACVLKSEDKERLKLKHGCLAYISPEILACSAAALSSGDKADKTVDLCCGKASDVWSMGVMLYTMLVGRYPFQESEPSALFSKICRGKFTVPEWLSSEARDLLNNILRRDPSQRFRTRDILLHPWIRKKGNCWDVPRFFMPLGSGGDVRVPRDQESSNINFQSLRNPLASFACRYEDQLVPDSYISEEDETMFE